MSWIIGAGRILGRLGSRRGSADYRGGVSHDSAVPAEAEIDSKARAQAAERRAAEAWDAYHRIAAERADAAHYEHLLETRERSFSWRITAPLRLARLVVRWLVRRAARALRRR
jgi:hypothetical protein